MTDKKEPLKVEFAPGCFDNFDGTQEELDALVLEIQELFADPEKALAMSRPVDIDELDDETLESIARQLGIDDDEDNSTRQLH